MNSILILILLFCSLSDSNVELDPAQVEILEKWKYNVDPLIPLKPQLDNLIVLNGQNSLYTYPNDFNINSFSSSLQPNNSLEKIFNGMRA